MTKNKKSLVWCSLSINQRKWFCLLVFEHKVNKQKLYCNEANNFQNSDFDGPWLLSEELLNLCSYARENPNLSNNIEQVSSLFYNLPKCVEWNFLIIHLLVYLIIHLLVYQ